jgi:flagellar export protein FliJ
MRAFHFKLGALLKLKENHREQALLKLVSSIKQVTQSKEQYQKTLDNYHRILQLIETQQQAKFSMYEIKSLQDSLENEKQSLVKSEQKLNHHKDIHQSRQKIFQKKDSEFKALLRLKDRQKELHFEEETLKEQKELEDIIAARFSFHSQNSSY